MPEQAAIESEIAAVRIDFFILFPWGRGRAEECGLGRHIASDAYDHEFQRRGTAVIERLCLLQVDGNSVAGSDFGALTVDAHGAVTCDHVIHLADVGEALWPDAGAWRQYQM